MLRVVAGLVAAAAAGAWIGTTSEWLSESGGWFGTQEMHLAAEGARGALAFAGAFGLGLAWRRGRLAGWLSPLNVAPFVGAALFVGIEFVPETLAYDRQFASELPRDYVAVEALSFALRVIVFGLAALVIIRTVVAAASWCERSTRRESKEMA